MKHVLIMFALLMTTQSFATGQATTVSNEIQGYTTNNPKPCFQRSTPAGSVSDRRLIRTNYVKPQANPLSRPSGTNSII